MAGTMSSRERMLCAIRGERPDRVPVAPWGFGHVDPDSDVGRELVHRCDLWIPGGGGGSSVTGYRLWVICCGAGVGSF